MGLNLLSRASAFLQQTDKQDDQLSLIDSAQRLASELIQADDKEGVKRALDGAMGDVVQGLVASLIQTQKPKDKEKTAPAAAEPNAATPAQPAHNKDPRFNSTIPTLRNQNAVSLQATQPAPVVTSVPSPVGNQPAAPVVANEVKPAAPVVNQPATPAAPAAVVNQPAAPAAVVNQPAAPVVNQPAAVVNQPAAVVNQPAAPAAVVNQPAAPALVVNQPAAPAAVVNQPAAPVVANEVKPAAPVVNQPAAVVNQPAAPAAVVNQPAAPAAVVNQPAAVVNQPAAPAAVVNQPAAVVNQPAAPAAVVNQPAAPAAVVNQPAAPAAVVNQPAAPALVVNQPAAPAAVVNQPAAPVVANEVKPAAPVVNQPAAPAAVVNQPAAVVNQPAAVVNQPAAPAAVVNQPAAVVNQAAINQAAAASTETANQAAPVANEVKPAAPAVANEAKPTAQAVAAVANEAKPEAIMQAANQVMAANSRVSAQVNQAQAVNSQVNEAVVQAANQAAPAAPAVEPLQAPPGTDPVAWQQWLAWQQIRTTFKKQNALNQDAATAQMSAEQGAQALEASGNAPAAAQAPQGASGAGGASVEAAPAQTAEPTTPTAQEIQPTPAAKPEARPDLASLEKFIGKANVEGMTHLNEGLEWNMNKGVWYAHSFSAYMKENGKQMPQHYWKGYASDKYFENHGFYKFQLLPGKSASEAIDAFFKGLTVCECYSAIMAIEYRTLMQTMGREKFDEVFGSKDKPVKNTMKIEAQPSTDNPLNSLSTATDAAKEQNSGKFGDRPAKPGEWYYFYNHPQYLLKHPAGAFQGENSLYMGKDDKGEQTWRGYGVDQVTEQEMLEEMASAHNSPRTAEDKARIKDMADKGFDVSIFEKTSFPDKVNWQEILSAPSFTYGGTTRTGGFMATAGQKLNADLIAELMGSLGVDIGGKKLKKDDEQGQS
jgi:hypothetical protein